MHWLYRPILPALMLGICACGGKNDATPTGPADTSGSGSTGSGADRGDSPLSRGNFLNHLTFPHNRIENASVKDATPALTDPLFVSATSADAAYLSDDDTVIGIHLNGIARAYPHKIAWYHEIINDTVGGQPIAVTYSPLTGSGLVFGAWGESTSDRLLFGVSGQVFNNNLIMYDRNDEQIRYPQMTHMAISGFRTGWILNTLPFIETTWGYWKRLYPDTFVISATTPGAFEISRYNVYPYGTYRDPGTGPRFPLFPPLDDNANGRLYPPKTPTLGVRFIEQAKAYPLPALGEEAVINDVVGGENILVVWFAGERMAAVYSRDHGGRTLTFEKAPTSSAIYPFLLRDRETGTVWDLKGRAISGELRNSVLLHIPAHSAYWFAWVTFWQNTEVYTAS